MHREQFNQLVQREFVRLRDLGDTKGEEYAGAEDVLADFRTVAQEVGGSPQQALMTYATKHWRAINSYAKSGTVLSEPIEGRIRDLILYMLLLRAMVYESADELDKGTEIRMGTSREGGVGTAGAIGALPPHQPSPYS